MRSLLLQLALCFWPAYGMDNTGNKSRIIPGTVVKEGEYPWHVAIYKDTREGHRQICGGTLISQYHVLTAAHCFWDHAGMKPYPRNIFKIVAGMFNRSYSSDDPGQQVEKIDIPPSFHGAATNLHSDIAVVTVSSPFTFNHEVQRVAVDWDDKYPIAPGDVGKVAAWGATEDGKFTEELLSSAFPVIEYSECLRNIKPAYQKYFGSDKICAGYRNGTTVCSGSSGGGLIFKHDVNPKGEPREISFVQGIVSTAVGGSSSSLCALGNYVAFTKVSIFKDFLEKYRVY